MALCEIGSISERRIAVLVDPKMSGLPPFLVRDSGVNSGFMIAQVTAAALVSENKSLAHPGKRRHHPDLGRAGRPCLDGDPRRDQGAADRRQCSGGGRNRVAGGGAGPRFPRPARLLAADRGGAQPFGSVSRLESDRYLAGDLAWAKEAVLAGELTAELEARLFGR